MSCFFQGRHRADPTDRRVALIQCENKGDEAPCLPLPVSAMLRAVLRG